MKSELQKAVEREYRRRKRETEPQVRAALATQPLMDVDMAIGLVTSQNVLRNCMEVTLSQSLPQGPDYFIELATRLACYALTALSPDDQEIGAMRVREGLLNKLADMQANGHVIQSEWQ